MKAVVTGGAGFIGSHLCHALLDQGLHVTAFDNMETGREENLAGLRARRGFTFIKGDVMDLPAVKAALAGADWALHIAGLADVIPSILRPDRYLMVNVMGTLNVLQAAREAGVSRVIYTASSSCYGAADRFPTAEDAPLRPMSPYALSKIMGEQMAFHWWKSYGLACVSLRLFNVYGPRLRAGGAYSSVFGVFLTQKAHGRPLTVVGDGSQTRDFVHAADVAEAFLAAARSDAAGEAFNIGSGVQSSVSALAGLIGGPVVRLAKRAGEPEHSWADIAKAGKLLGWRPKISLEQGVGQMLERLEDWRGAAPVEAKE